MNRRQGLEKVRRTNLTRHGRRTGMWTIAILLALQGYVLPSPVAAESGNNADAAVSDDSAKAEQARPIFDLGRFQIQEMRPTRNETAKITFAMHLALSPTIGQPVVSQLEHWRHRLRDQVIIAVRVADTKDFSEPGLDRLRRMILLRVNRLFKALLVEDIFFAEFTFSTQ